jgi:hypothetical protein
MTGSFRLMGPGVPIAPGAPASRPGFPGWPLVVGVFFRLLSGSAAGVGTTMRNRPQDYSQESGEATAAGEAEVYAVGGGLWAELGGAPACESRRGRPKMTRQCGRHQRTSGQ